MSDVASASPRHRRELNDVRDQTTRAKLAECRSDRVSSRREQPSTSHPQIPQKAPRGQRGGTAPPSKGNPAKTRPKGWWKPLKRGPQGRRFLEFANLEPGSIAAAMVHWLLKKKVQGAQYSARELASRFNIGMELATRFLRCSCEGGWGWVEWCEDIVNNGSTLPRTQYPHHEGVTSFPRVELVTTDRAREAS
jgi:hypothetical protein